ncbi:conserved Plasmodium protein, unknown function [Plasmodium vinckei]|uniref:Uncharacterized protein n=1 Tax=Plasmodium vinckei TaxID=5860 RepID=A0A6V7T6N5_PLAVN|nr:conserved Plasmodium protein, unknown function [Plasmodium vinckei]
MLPFYHLKKISEEPIKYQQIYKSFIIRFSFIFKAMNNQIIILIFFSFLLQLNNISCSYTLCSLVTNEDTILSYCKNGSDCYIKNTNNSPYSSIICVCKKFKENYFAGPDCSIRIPLHYKIMKNNDVLNTSWIEDLLKLNTWKNDENRVGKICVNPQCN